MINLWEETLDVLKRCNKSWENVLYISNIKKSHYYEKESVIFEIPKNEFEEIAKTINYDNGFGGNEINIQLKIIGENWWLERYEYDGSERWVYKEKPEKPNLTLSQVKALLIDFDSNLYILENTIL